MNRHLLLQDIKRMAKAFDDAPVVSGPRYWELHGTKAEIKTMVRMLKTTAGGNTEGIVRKLGRSC